MIGRDNGMPWHLPDDLKHFKARTMGKPMLMGRKTFESIGRPLPGRTSLVLTRDPEWHADGVVVVRSLDDALCWAGACRSCAHGRRGDFSAGHAAARAACSSRASTRTFPATLLPEARSRASGAKSSAPSTRR